MRRKLVLLVFAVLILAGGAAYYVLVPGHAPAGQSPLAALDTVGFDQQFKAASGSTRVLVMLSPT
jgi:hypothetical protein